jgi:hypothetical protein
MLMVAGQAAVQCSQPVQYSTCTTEAHQQMAKCSSNVSGSPTGAYYRCLCTGKQALVTCYTICGDDPNLQLQLPTTQRDADAACKLASEQEAKDPKPTSTTSRIDTATSSSKNGIATIISQSQPSTNATTTLVLNEIPASSPTANRKPSDKSGIVFSSDSRMNPGHLLFIFGVIMFSYL